MAIGEGFSDVLLAAQLGAEWAWRVIYRDLSPSLIGYLRLHGVQEPEDLTGEVFVHVVRGLRNFSGDEAQFRSWIFLIAHHRMLDDRRSRSRKPSEPVELRSIEQHGPIGNSEEEALDQLSVAEVRRLLEGLSDAQRHVLLLRVIGRANARRDRRRDRQAGKLGQGPSTQGDRRHPAQGPHSDLGVVPKPCRRRRVRRRVARPGC
jgi:RNA polymerase sigma factor (sigma-70 family)